MKNKISNNAKIDFQLFIEELNENIFNGELTEIIEVTYIYEKIENNLFFNTTLFEKFAGISYEESVDFNKLRYILEKKLESKISQIDYYILKEIHILTHKKGDKIRLDILKRALIYIKNALHMAYVGLPFELEKAGYIHNLEKEEIKNRIRKLRSLERENFGGKIKTKKEEVILCYEFLIQKGEKLTGTERNELQYFIDKVGEYLPNDYKYKNGKDKNIIEFDPVFSTLIKRSDYVKIFNLVFEIYELPQRAKITNAGSIYDGEDFLEIPNSSSYKEKTIASILKLMLHEIMAHGVNLENSKRRLGNFRGANNLQKEEGLAVLLERLFEGNKLEDIGIISSLPTLLIGEICNPKDFKKFISITYEDTTSAFLRFKRNYPIKYKGVQHKDTSYSRGILKASHFLQKGGNIKDLFLGKVSFEDIPLLKKVPLLDENKTELLPLFIAELIYFTLTHRGKKNITKAKFMGYLEKKYDYLDISTLDIPYSRPQIKKKICQIFDILNKYIPNAGDEYCTIII